MTYSSRKAQQFAARANDALVYVDDAHGFGVVGERDRSETSPYGRRGNGVVRPLDESYDHMVLTGGFSKAYSSLLAFVACPPELKRLIRITAPPYLYSGPSPVASLASVLVGLQITRPEAMTCGPSSGPGPGGSSTAPGSRSSRYHWPTPATSPRPAVSCSTRAST